MKRKTYEPVREFERQTSYCPLYLAWQIVDEARNYFRTPIPDAFADQLARRAETVFAHHPFWRRKYQSLAGRDAILMSMRHWLAAVLAKERPALFRALPESFKIGLPLPMKPNPAPAHVARVRQPPRASRRKSVLPRRSNTGAPRRPFVHGCHLLEF